MMTPENPRSVEALSEVGLPLAMRDSGGIDAREVFDQMPEGVVILDCDWRFLFANRRASEMVNGVEMVGHNLFEVFPGNAEEPFNTAYRTTMATREPAEFEAYYGAPLDVWFKIDARPYAGDGLVVFFSDITSRKKAEMREQELAGRLAQVMQVTSDGVVGLDRQWRYTYLNGRAQEMLLDPEGKLVGKNIWEEFPAAVGSSVWEVYHRSMHERRSGKTEMYYGEPLNRWLCVQSEPSEDGIVVFFHDITEQKVREQRLDEQQDLLAVVQRAARMATWELDPETGRVSYGPGSYDVFGHPLAELTDLANLEKVMLPGSVEAVRTAIIGAVASGEQVVLEFSVLAAEGRSISVEARGQAVPGSDGKPRLRGMTIDITERKLNEQHLIASEERYRVLADLNPQAIWMGDAAGNVTYANLGFLAYIGLTPDNLDGLGWLDAFAPGDRARVVDVWTTSVTTGVDYDIEALLRNATTNEYRYWHLKAAPVRDAKGAILHWLGVAYDIHDTKTHAASLRAEQAETERRRAELETLYKTTPVGLALFDPVEFKFLNLNDHEAEMLGYPKENILGRPLSEIATPDGMPGLMQLFRSVAAGNVIKDKLVEGELAARPGERRAWSVNYAPVYNEDGTIRAISTASIEITNQKKAEAALIQSEKLAAVGRLASSISHEINNPLEAITNLLYLLAMDEQLPDDLKIYVHMAQSELSRVSQIATQTLRFHRQAVNPTEVTPEELVGAVIRLYTGRLTNSNIRVDARYDAKTKVLCFENDIRQVLNNLIANAIDAMRTGGKLMIRAHEGHDFSQGSGANGAAEPRAGVRLTIADTGHGMSEETLKRVFEPFFTTKDLQGTGLGLWISAGIVDRHEGRLRVRSSVDPQRHGTVFTLFLPCEESGAKPQQAK